MLTPLIQQPYEISDYLSPFYKKAEAQKVIYVNIYGLLVVELGFNLGSPETGPLTLMLWCLPSGP